MWRKKSRDTCRCSSWHWQKRKRTSDNSLSHVLRARKRTRDHFRSLVFIMSIVLLSMWSEKGPNQIRCPLPSSNCVIKTATLTVRRLQPVWNVLARLGRVLLSLFVRRVSRPYGQLCTLSFELSRKWGLEASEKHAGNHWYFWCHFVKLSCPPL